MKTLKVLAIALIATLLAACAGPTKHVDNDNLFCAIAGGIAGGAGSTLAAGASGGAAVGGAMLALILCNNQPEAAEAEAVAPAAVCMDTPPAGALLDAQGCAFDTDKDGVVDGIDMCQQTPEGVQVDIFGCALDEDRDGVADYKDMCLGTPLGTIVNTDGCPLPGEKLLSLTGVNFATNKAVLTADAKEILEQAVTLLKQTDDVLDVRVEGHTDSRGGDNFNMLLSEKRAEAVVAYLESQGVSADSLTAVGMGETAPIANNNTAAGQAANRRVDFVVK